MLPDDEYKLLMSLRPAKAVYIYKSCAIKNSERGVVKDSIDGVNPSLVASTIYTNR
jgi:hypothetical protein